MPVQPGHLFKDFATLQLGEYRCEWAADIPDRQGVENGPHPAVAGDTSNAEYLLQTVRYFLPSFLRQEFDR
jgi:hypothetical protein